MMIPRLGRFRSAGAMPKYHLVLVDGDRYKSVCTRMFLKNGSLVEPGEIDCRGCLNRGYCVSYGKGARSVSSQLVSR